MEIQFENLVWKFSLEMIDGNLDGNLVGSLEIQMEIQLQILILGNLVSKFSLEIIDGNLVGIQIFGNLDPWKFSFKIQNGDLVWK